MLNEAIDFDSTVILASEDLQKGLYVSYLDRPWIETPFPIQGFVIQSDEDLQRLREHCEYVFVATERGSFADGYQRHMESTASLRKIDFDRSSVDGLAKWKSTSTTEEEYRNANAAIAKLRTTIVRAFVAAARHLPPDIEAIRTALGPLRQSIERCPDAALYAVRISDTGDYILRHALNCAILGVIMGRALGLSDSQTINLAVGSAVLDIGKVRVSQDLLNRPNTIELSSDELSQLRKHVSHSLDIFAGDPRATKLLRPIIAHHHERYDGTGYPNKLEGDDIPLLARIAGLIDFFDAMISHRAYGRRATPNEAMRFVRERGGKDFCPVLVDQFVQVMRLYPTGSLVELSDGRVGRVIQQEEKGLISPRVQILLDEKKEKVQQFASISLTAEIGQTETPCIVKCLKVGSYGIVS